MLVQISLLVYLLRRLNGQQIAHKIFIEVLDMICLAINKLWENPLYFNFKIWLHTELFI